MSPQHKTNEGSTAGSPRHMCSEDGPGGKKAPVQGVDGTAPGRDLARSPCLGLGKEGRNEGSCGSGPREAHRDGGNLPYRSAIKEGLDLSENDRAPRDNVLILKIFDFAIASGAAHFASNEPRRFNFRVVLSTISHDEKRNNKACQWLQDSTDVTPPLNARCGPSPRMSWPAMSSPAVVARAVFSDETSTSLKPREAFDSHHATARHTRNRRRCQQAMMHGCRVAVALWKVHDFVGKTLALMLAGKPRFS